MRTGLGRFLFLAHSMCRLFGVWRGSIIAAVNASPAPQAQKDQLLNLISVIDSSCAAVDALKVVWEN